MTPQSYFGSTSARARSRNIARNSSAAGVGARTRSVTIMVAVFQGCSRIGSTHTVEAGAEGALVNAVCRSRSARCPAG
jgi:hypothetical protein